MMIIRADGNVRVASLRFGGIHRVMPWSGPDAN